MEIAFSAAPMGPVERVIRLTRGLGVALAIALFWSCALVFAWFLVPYAQLREREPLARRRLLQRAIGRAFRWFLRLLELTTLYRSAHGEAEAAELHTHGPVMLVANHPSLLDVTVILARTPHTCCLVKNSLMNNPLVGRLLRACGHVAAGDGSLSAGLTVLEAMRQRLHDGFSVLIFPEGTRSPPGGLHKFRRGAFVIAQRAGVPVVPLFLRCDPPALGKGTPVWRHPRACPTLTVHVGSPMDTNGVGANELCKSVEQDFRLRVLASADPVILGKQGT